MLCCLILVDNVLTCCDVAQTRILGLQHPFWGYLKPFHANYGYQLVVLIVAVENVLPFVSQTDPEGYFLFELLIVEAA